MLIKPWSETQAPRHVFEEEVDGTPNLIPQVEVECAATADFLLIAPETTRVITQNLPHRKKVGSVRLAYQLETPRRQAEEYDEDEQLYAAIMEKSLKDKYQDLSLDIFEAAGCLSIEVPHITNTIATNVLAQALVAELGPKIGTWITLAPCSLNNNQTLNRLGESEQAAVQAIPPVRPPHAITGISAAVSSRLALAGAKYVSLVLNAEGQPGYEKLEPDSLVDVSHVVAQLVGADEAYLKAVSLLVRKKNSYSNSMMYI